MTKFQELLINDEWIAELAYLADIFSLLNELNISMQGQHKDVCLQYEIKWMLFKKKILLWQTRVAEEDRKMFLNLDEFMREKDVNQQVVVIVQQHLQSLTKYFDRYFSKKN